ncbi:transketolase [Strongylocentrotus purpuratus]|uniref:Transketolase n=1 Tax=Strongylocentrotus purpuratus TaxID=7668 RepID=A0A7M6UWW3_STRPU|nr:transketolase [Strongylocentrotus purpuratus]|eukprot:NP_001229589.1 transketolase [Strongylocentrotus purpuratus]
MSATLADDRKQALKDIANKLRVHSINCTTAAGSGHPTSCCSAAEIMSVLFFNTMRYSISKPRDPGSDRFIMSKGHAAPILYAAWAEAGLVGVDDLNNLRKIDNDLEGHPTPRLSFVDVATGSLGQGLSVAAGMAYTAKYFDKADYRTYCLVGDGESAEGSIWEACAFASYYKLDNLVAIFDVNRLGQSQPASLEHQVEVYQKRLEAFGMHAIIVDGHDVEALNKALYDASTVKDKPTAIVAKTFKGKGCPDVEDLENWHGKALGAKAEGALNAIKALISNPGPHGIVPPASTPLAEHDLSKVCLSEPPSYKTGDKVATRVAYGTALVKLGNSIPNVVALDGDTKNSTFAITYKNAFPDRFVECFIAEQNLVGVGIGCACRDRNVVFVSAFACFLARAYDQIRMGAISQTNVNFVGSHCGVSIGEDGPSQMALEDIAIFRAIPTCTVFYPSDPVSCERAIELAAKTKGITFTRTSRPTTDLLYGNDEVFEVGKAKVIRQSAEDKVVLVGAGITLHEAVAAADLLENEGIKVTVIDPFTIKPIDAATLTACAKAAGGRVLTVEDHYREGGLGEAVAGALASQPGIVVRRLAVDRVPRSGPSKVLIDMFGISANCIVKAVKEMLA